MPNLLKDNTKSGVWTLTHLEPQAKLTGEELTLPKWICEVWKRRQFIQMGLYQLKGVKDLEESG